MKAALGWLTLLVVVLGLFAAGGYAGQRRERARWDRWYETWRKQEQEKGFCPEAPPPCGVAPQRTAPPPPEIVVGEVPHTVKLHGDVTFRTIVSETLRYDEVAREIILRESAKDELDHEWGPGTTLAKRIEINTGRQRFVWTYRFTLKDADDGHVKGAKAGAREL